MRVGCGDKAGLGKERGDSSAHSSLSQLTPPSLDITSENLSEVSLGIIEGQVLDDSRAPTKLDFRLGRSVKITL